MLSEVFLRKLELFGALEPDDQKFLLDVAATSVRIPAHTTFVHEGDVPDHVHLVVSGLACRFKIQPSGRRQISAFILPGDFCDINVFILKKMDHSLSALNDTIVSQLSRRSILEMMERPAIARALLFSSIVEESVLREWVGNIGQRNAVQRMAHLFCELFARMQSLGLAHGRQISLPINQTELGDSLGISLVHTNKSLKKLQDENLVRFKSGSLNILDIDKLKERCQFQSDYLHLEGGSKLT